MKNEYIDFATNWHDGQSSMLYAISSTGDLSVGSQQIYNDDENRYCTDDEQLSILYSSLTGELERIKTDFKIDRESYDDYGTVCSFLEWAIFEESRIDERVELALEG